jgi:hypothetical protein
MLHGVDGEAVPSVELFTGPSRKERVNRFKEYVIYRHVHLVSAT